MFITSNPLLFHSSNITKLKTNKYTSLNCIWHWVLIKNILRDRSLVKVNHLTSWRMYIQQYNAIGIWTTSPHTCMYKISQPCHGKYHTRCSCRQRQLHNHSHTNILLPPTEIQPNVKLSTPYFQSELSTDGKI